MNLCFHSMLALFVHNLLHQTIVCFGFSINRTFQLPKMSIKNEQTFYISRKVSLRQIKLWRRVLTFFKECLLHKKTAKRVLRFYFFVGSARKN